jgi:hypothetical protein
MRRLPFAVVGLAGVVALAPVSALGLANVVYFKTPSGKIVCAWVEESLSTQDAVFCEATTGLKPPIPRSAPSCQHLTYVGNRVGLQATGAATLIPCADARPFADPARTSVLPHGKTIKGGGIACSEAATGLTCRNRSGHGFFLSPQRWHTF